MWKHLIWMIDDVEVVDDEPLDFDLDDAFDDEDEDF